MRLTTAILLAICLRLVAHASQPITIDHHKQLFLDDHLIAAMTNVTRSVEQAQKFAGNPILWPESWEPPMATVYGSVLREGSKYKMWYKSGMGVGYAESDDGITWRKPNLGLTRIEGRDSNILFTKKSKTEGPEHFPFLYELFGVHRDDRDPDPARRYKMGFLEIDWKYKGTEGDPWHKNQRRGLGVAASPDGIHWTLSDPWASEAIVDGATHWMFDAARGRYILYGRTRKPGPGVEAAWATNSWFKEWFSGRAVARIESSDFLHWDFNKPDTAPVALTADLQDKPGTEIYSMKVFPYEGVYIGLVQVFHATPEDSTLDVQLAISRDTIHFTRVGGRKPFITVGSPGTCQTSSLP